MYYLYVLKLSQLKMAIVSALGDNHYNLILEHFGHPTNKAHTHKPSFITASSPENSPRPWSPGILLS